MGTPGNARSRAIEKSSKVLIRLTNEDDFVSVMSWGHSEIMGVPYKVFHWTPDFNENVDSPVVPIWITLPGLPPNYFQPSMLKSIGDAFGNFLKWDNAIV